MKIYLIGMPGSGKTTLGKQVAAALSLPFVDLDDEIEAHEGKTIPEIFEARGEDYFRKTESALLQRWASGDMSFVMSTGGGAPCFYDGIEVINRSGVSIFLDVPIDQLVERVAQKSDRPLLDTTNQNELVQRMESFREQRLPVYRQAKFVLQNPMLGDILGKLRK
jgi:shikimate kinase